MDLRLRGNAPSNGLEDLPYTAANKVPALFPGEGHVGSS